MPRLLIHLFATLLLATVLYTKVLNPSAMSKVREGFIQNASRAEGGGPDAGHTTQDCYTVS